MKKSKKGLSPVVATVLLIALVLVLAIIIFLWARGFVSEQIEKFDSPIDKACKDVKFDVSKVSTTTNKITIDFVNRGNIAIYSFSIKEVKGGDENMKTIDISLQPRQAESKEIGLTATDLDKIIIYPNLFGNVKDSDKNKLKVCLENSKAINLSSS